MAVRTAGHKLVRKPLEDADGRSGWICECGTDLGQLSVHRARAAWQAHKATLNGHAEPEQAGG